ncbi:MAG: zinc ribbon domain-containing protein, partial [Clostridia bacterium]|nr:zinc ribbon domain-containing protein [Clostridia bacterium]
MNCPKCNANVPEGSAFCQNCGERVAADNGAAAPESVFTPAAESPVAAFARKFSSPLFLAIAIIVSAGAGASLLSGNLDILSVLMAVGLWIVYSASRSENTGLLTSGMRVINVGIKIAYIIVNVACGIIMVCGFIVFAIFASLGGNLADAGLDYDAVVGILTESGIKLTGDAPAVFEKLYEMFAEQSLFYLGAVFFVLFLVCGGVVLAYNIIFLGAFSKHLTRIVKALKAGEPCELCQKGVHVKLLVFGILDAIPMALPLVGALLSADIDQM